MTASVSGCTVERVGGGGCRTDFLRPSFGLSGNDIMMPSPPAASAFTTDNGDNADIGDTPFGPGEGSVGGGGGEGATTAAIIV